MPSKSFASAFGAALLIAAVASTGLTANAAGPDAPAPGGSGTLGLSRDTCFKSLSKQVPMVCGNPVVHYKITALMGDPLGHYGVSWKVSGIHIAHADGKGTDYFSSGERLPAEIWNAREGVELSLYGVARVLPLDWPFAALQFNTGVGVKATGEMSLNVPDGYNWDKFLVEDRAGDSLESACSDKRPWIPPSHAKKLMRGGLRLSDLKICNQTSINVDRLERAITAWCTANPESRAKYCPQKEKADEAAAKKPQAGASAALGKPVPAMLNALDDATDVIALRHARQAALARFQDQARLKCKQEQVGVDKATETCMANTCRGRTEPTEQQCKEIPRRPEKHFFFLTNRDTGPCNAACYKERERIALERERERDQERRDLKVQQEAWDRDWSALSKQCQEVAEERKSVAACRLRSATACNPSGQTVESCVQASMVKAPAAIEPEMAAFKAGLAQKNSAPQTPARPRFLD